jgi:hypothetical protein
VSELTIKALSDSYYRSNSIAGELNRLGSAADTLGNRTLADSLFSVADEVQRLHADWKAAVDGDLTNDLKAARESQSELLTAILGGAFSTGEEAK